MHKAYIFFYFRSTLRKILIRLLDYYEHFSITKHISSKRIHQELMVTVMYLCSTHRLSPTHWMYQHIYGSSQLSSIIVKQSSTYQRFVITGWVVSPPYCFHRCNIVSAILGRFIIQFTNQFIFVNVYSLASFVKTAFRLALWCV